MYRNGQKQIATDKWDRNRWKLAEKNKNRQKWVERDKS